MSINQETIERNVAATRRLFEEGFTRGNADVCDKLVSPDAIEHQRGLKGGAEDTPPGTALLFRRRNSSPTAPPRPPPGLPGRLVLARARQDLRKGPARPARASCAAP